MTIYGEIIFGNNILPNRGEKYIFLIDKDNERYFLYKFLYGVYNLCILPKHIKFIDSIKSIEIIYKYGVVEIFNYGNNNQIILENSNQGDVGPTGMTGIDGISDSPTGPKGPFFSSAYYAYSCGRTDNLSELQQYRNVTNVTSLFYNESLTSPDVIKTNNDVFTLNNGGNYIIKLNITGMDLFLAFHYPLFYYAVLSMNDPLGGNTLYNMGTCVSSGFNSTPISPQTYTLDSFNINYTSVLNNIMPGSYFSVIIYFGYVQDINDIIPYAISGILENRSISIQRI